MRARSALVSGLLLSSLPTTLLAGEKVIHASPGGGRISHLGKELPTLTPKRALKAARPGAVIQLLPGRYRAPLKVKVSGAPDRPIVVRGGPGVVWTNGARPGQQGAPAIKLAGVAWVELEGLRFEDCWPVAVRIKDSRYVTVRDCVFVGSKRAVYASGPGTHHLLIEDNRWTQDPSKKIWTTWDWAELHHGKLAHMNGALLAGKDLAGGVVFRRNEIGYAFNGIRLKADPKRVGKRNVNVEVYGNWFHHVRDNPVEPEGTALNWSIHHNRFEECYAPFSFTEVSGGRFYVYRNVGWSTTRPGGPGHTRGKVFKLAPGGPFPALPTLVFHNSWLTHSPLIAGGTTRHLAHWNNAIQFSGPRFDPFPWHSSYRFDHDVVNRPFPPNLLEKAQERSGVSADPRFRAPEKGDFRLASDSPAIDAGRKGLAMGLPPRYFTGARPDAGAYEGDRWVKGSSFPNVAAPYPERPRILGYWIRGREARVCFSSPLAPMRALTVTILTDGDPHVGTAQTGGAFLFCTFPGPVPVEHRGLRLPALAGPDGRTATSWASADPRVHLGRSR